MSMTTKCGSATPERKKDVLVGLVAAVSRGWSVQSRKLAANLDENRYIYFVYGAFDGLSLSCNTVKLGCDILLTDGISSSADAMHDWVLTPAGMAFNIAESALFIGLSAFANYIKDDDKDYVRRQIADYWPYARDAMKALKNGYKGIRSTFQVTSALLGQDLRCMIIPLGIALGVVSMLNRIWYRSMKEERLEKQKQNGKTLLEIKALNGIDSATYQKYHDSIQRQSESLRTKALLSAAYSGFVDGLYLFMGVGMVTTLLPQFFVAVAVVSILFSITCIVTRMYEEYDYQRKLQATQTKIELALCGKELETLFSKLQILSRTIALQRLADESLRLQQGELMLALDEKMKEFGAHRERLRSQVVLTQMSAALAGLKSGLVVYGAVAGGMFAVAALTAVPPAMVLACVIAGLASLTYFVWRALKNNAQHLQKQTDAIPYRLASRLRELKEQLAANRIEVAGLEPSELQEAMDIKPTPSSSVDSWGEFCRAGASGVKQGQKAADYTLTPMQIADSDGHFQENSFMRWAAIVCSALFACVLALRALARGFGRTSPVDLVNQPLPPKPPSTIGCPLSSVPDTPSMAMNVIVEKLPKFHHSELDDDLVAEFRRLHESDGDADELSPKDLPKKRPISATQPAQTSRSPSFLSRFSLFRPVGSVGNLPTLVANPSGFRTAQGLM